VSSSAPEGLCPKCLMEQALAADSSPERTLVVTPAQSAPRKLPQPGEQFGSYRIVRELGRGGMGAVYAAEDLESGRYLALKVLGQQFDSPDARKRFLREGRLAASINHPNSVYVYGTEEIEGTPAIAMELVSGGTLQERVQRMGPFPAPEAVDAILQIIAGLEAAQAIGILHRDVKPSNCFRDADGTTKIGDFGLSISTAARGETDITLAGSFLGTPAFCSPEQLRGEELNARSDIYSVGVTLYYLLTGRTPFEGKTLVQLLATVLEQPAPSPRLFKPDVPTGLAKVVLRCLAKGSGDRFRDYNELRQALAPYSSAAPTPATVSLRCVAGLIDLALLGLLGLLLHWPLWGDIANLLNTGNKHPQKLFVSMSIGLVLSLIYYAVLEGIWGASFGKAVCGLRVVGKDRNPPGVLKAFLRAAMYGVLPMFPVWAVTGFDPLKILDMNNGFARAVASYSQGFMILLLFVTMRRRNGFAAIQDLITGTRVILKAAHLVRPILQAAPEPLPLADLTPKIGPYHILQHLESSSDAEWLLGYDARLLRKTWVRVVPPGTPSIGPGLRNLGRVGRLRWIAGRRSATENWDAFEAVTGKPLVELLQERQPWNLVRFWLFDLAKETESALKDGTLPASLSLDRVWITADGRAKLLDFPAPSSASYSSAADQREHSDTPPLCERCAEGATFLNLVARAALEGGGEATEANRPHTTQPMPLHAREFLERLSKCPRADDTTQMLAPLLQRAAIVTRWRRLALVGGCALFPILVTLAFTIGMRAMESIQSSQPEITRLNQLLQTRTMLHRHKGPDVNIPDDRLYAIYIANHFRSIITNEAVWPSIYVRSMIQPADRHFAEQSVADHAALTPDEIQQADSALQSQVSNFDPFAVVQKPGFPFAVGVMSLFGYVCIPALIAALACRGGLVLRAAGLAVARGDGTQASRLRVLWRGLVAWSPVLLAGLVFCLLVRPLGMGRAVTAILIPLLALTVWSLALPGRGLQDRLAGTWLVPR
jgi:eukaryotic-like serine/threonine-protein kinase